MGRYSVRTIGAGYGLRRHISAAWVRPGQTRTRTCDTAGVAALDTLSRPTRLWVVFGLNVALVGVLVAVGIGSHSLGVLAEGADYLADAAAIGVSVLAIRLSNRPPAPARPHGYPNATTWAALVNGGWLLGLTGLLGAAAIGRLVTGTTQVHGLPVLVASSVAAVVMVVGALILSGDERGDDDEGGDLNISAVLLDTAADAAAAGAVAVTGAVILATGRLYWLDPTVALVVSGVVAYHALKLLRRVVVALRSRHTAACGSAGSNNPKIGRLDTAASVDDDELLQRRTCWEAESS